MLTKEMILEVFKLNVIIKKHTYMRMKERNINIHEIEEAILSDEIIEQYQDDYPLPSALLLGKFNTNKPMHIVCAPSDLGLIIISVYSPSEKFWKKNWKKRLKK